MGREAPPGPQILTRRRTTRELRRHHRAPAGTVLARCPDLRAPKLPAGARDLDFLGTGPRACVKMPPSRYLSSPQSGLPFLVAGAASAIWECSPA
ncbi:unnamed protein product [Diplocarpon coronariae]|nr:hypothetical protein JHW43_003322 [Diplocarpon mali]